VPTELIAPTHRELDVLDSGAVRAFLRASGASSVVNFAAWADVDSAEAEVGDTGGKVYALNVAYPRDLAETCATLDVHLIHVSTDYVFDGTRVDRPYREDDPTGPTVCWYAETKLRGEQALLAVDGATVARIEMPFSGRQVPRRDFARTILARLREGETIVGVADQRVTPVFLDDAVTALRLLVEQPYAGVIHVAAADWITPFDFARSIARRLGLDAALVQPAEFATFASRRPARRPQHSWLDVSLFSRVLSPNILRTVEAQLDSWCNQLAAEPVHSKV
jgi:dTDP-4-dehydrorhamnose reductase